MWSEPHQIAGKLLNSYNLEFLDGQPVDGEFHAQRLREFIPRAGTELATQQEEVVARGREDNSDMLAMEDSRTEEPNEDEESDTSSS